jgi:hypothetical protein
MSAAGVGINYEAVKQKKKASFILAWEMYLTGGGKLSQV